MDDGPVIEGLLGRIKARVAELKPGFRAAPVQFEKVRGEASQCFLGLLTLRR